MLVSCHIYEIPFASLTFTLLCLGIILLISAPVPTPQFTHSGWVLEVGMIFTIIQYLECRCIYCQPHDDLQDTVELGSGSIANPPILFR